MTQTTAAAPGQYASGPPTQETSAIQTAMPHLPWEEDPKDLIQPEDCKVELVVRGNITGLQNKTRKTLWSSQLPKISLQKIFPGGLD